MARIAIRRLVFPISFVFIVSFLFLIDPQGINNLERDQFDADYFKSNDLLQYASLLDDIVSNSTESWPLYPVNNLHYYHRKNNSKWAQIVGSHMQYRFCSLPKNGYRTLTSIMMITEDSKLCANLKESENMSIAQWRMACGALIVKRENLEESMNLAIHHRYRHVGQIEANTTLAIVRDPIDRFISAYLDKCVKRKRYCLQHEQTNFPAFVARFTKHMIEKHTTRLPRTKKKVHIPMVDHYEPQSAQCPLEELMDRGHVMKFCHGQPFAKRIGGWLNQETIDDNLRSKIITALGDTSRGSYFTFLSPDRIRVEENLRTDKKLFNRLLGLFYEDYQTLSTFFPLQTTFDSWKKNCCNC